MKLPHVLILYTGGTFGMDFHRESVSHSITLAIPQLSASLLKKRFQDQVPELNQLARCDVEVILNRDSSHIGPEEWILFARKIQGNWQKYDGIVLLHGTDTLAYTASALSFLLRPCHKPVVITGAQRPLTALRTDARTNLISAVEIAAHGPRKLVNQVTVFFGDKLYQGNRVRKRSAADFSAFDCPHASPLAVVGTTIRYVDPPSTQNRKYQKTRTKLLPEFSKKVLMTHVTPGFPSSAVSELFLSRLDGIVMIVFPSLTAPTHDPSFLKLLEKAKKQELPLTLTTESSAQAPAWTETRVNYAAGKELLSLGGLWAGAMTPECTYVKTCLLLGQSKNYRRFVELWKEDFADEGIVGSHR